jgi:hypothetical protein
MLIPNILGYIFVIDYLQLDDYCFQLVLGQSEDKLVGAMQQGATQNMPKQSRGFLASYRRHLCVVEIG